MRIARSRTDSHVHHLRCGGVPRERNRLRYARVPKRQRHTVLSDQTRKWLEHLPEAVRPRELSARFPRIANQLAACWRDDGLIEYLLEDMVVDRRGGR